MLEYDPEKDTVMTRDQVRNFDSYAINKLGIPGTVLMENAGRSCAQLILQKLKGLENPKVAIFCGTGNNGGDGYVIARHLFNNGVEVSVVICGDETKITGDAKIHLDIIKKKHLKIETLNLNSDNIAENVNSLSSKASLLVDGLFGTGLKGKLREEYITLINAINSQKMPIIAIDIPSGLDCDLGQPLPTAIKAQTTVSFVAAKKGFLCSESDKYTGQIYIASIGIEPTIL